METEMRKAKKHNILTVDNPPFLSEWDYDNNPGLSPTNFTGCSDQKIWWKCKLGHRWKTAIKYRTIGTRCPYCSNKKAWVGFNDLVTLEPELSKEWDYEKNKGLRPEQFTRYSNKTVW
ncbi:MAG: zinc-ribbon domain-containing protein, partial [Oscillospiraceae bacterium]|nr:zinc-ribbon domain-containing protein [Oscillospiraceae bacterium]